MNTKQKAMLASYGRSFLAAVTTAFMITGGDILALDGDSLKAILAAGISAVLPVAIRAANPKDPAFGKIADGVTEAVVGKLTAKKATKKK
jgi:hypothetical protein